MPHAGERHSVEGRLAPILRSIRQRKPGHALLGVSSEREFHARLEEEMINGDRIGRRVVRFATEQFQMVVFDDEAQSDLQFF